MHRQMDIFDLLHEVDKKMSKEASKQVMIEKAINMRLMCDYVVSCSYGDIVLIICMLHDYVKWLDQERGDEILYQAYYREKFIKIADRLAEQIEYDYDKAVEKCRKKQLKEERNSDIGEDGLSQLIKRDLKKVKNKGTEFSGEGYGFDTFKPFQRHRRARSGR